MTRLEMELYKALTGFMEMWGSRDAHSESKMAQAKRAKMWDRANQVVAKVRGGSPATSATAPYTAPAEPSRLPSAGQQSRNDQEGK